MKINAKISIMNKISHCSLKTECDPIFAPLNPPASPWSWSCSSEGCWQHSVIHIPGSFTKNTVTLEYLLRSMYEPTSLFINNIPFNPCKLLSSSLLFNFTVIGTKVLISQVSEPVSEPWLSHSCFLSCHCPLIMEHVLTFSSCVLRTWNNTEKSGGALWCLSW